MHVRMVVIFNFSHVIGEKKSDRLYRRRQTVTALDQDFIGSSIALFAAPSSEAVDVIGKIEVGEGLPHPMMNGEWIKTEAQNPAYMLYEGRSLDNALNYADSCNFNLVHIGDIFKSWGHFDLHTLVFRREQSKLKLYRQGESSWH